MQKTPAVIDNWGRRGGGGGGEGRVGAGEDCTVIGAAFEFFYNFLVKFPTLGMGK